MVYIPDEICLLIFKNYHILKLSDLQNIDLTCRRFYEVNKLAWSNISKKIKYKNGKKLSSNRRICGKCFIQKNKFITKNLHYTVNGTLNNYLCEMCFKEESCKYFAISNINMTLVKHISTCSLRNLVCEKPINLGSCYKCRDYYSSHCFNRFKYSLINLHEFIFGSKQDYNNYIQRKQKQQDILNEKYKKIKDRRLQRKIKLQTQFTNGEWEFIYRHNEDIYYRSMYKYYNIVDKYITSERPALNKLVKQIKDTIQEDMILFNSKKEEIERYCISIKFNVNDISSIIRDYEYDNDDYYEKITKKIDKCIWKDSIDDILKTLSEDDVNYIGDNVVYDLKHQTPITTDLNIITGFLMVNVEFNKLFELRTEYITNFTKSLNWDEEYKKMFLDSKIKEIYVNYGKECIPFYKLEFLEFTKTVDTDNIIRCKYLTQLLNCIELNINSIGNGLGSGNSNSPHCNSYINHGYGNLFNTVLMLQEMNYFFTKTTYLDFMTQNNLQWRMNSDTVTYGSSNVDDYNYYEDTPQRSRDCKLTIIRQTIGQNFLRSTGDIIGIPEAPIHLLPLINRHLIKWEACSIDMKLSILQLDTIPIQVSNDVVQFIIDYYIKYNLENDYTLLVPRRRILT